MNPKDYEPRQAFKDQIRAEADGNPVFLGYDQGAGKDTSALVISERDHTGRWHVVMTATGRAAEILIALVRAGRP